MSAQPIQCRAAVAFAAKEPLQIKTITVEPPKKGEVRIKILYTAVCHTDQYTLNGSDPEAIFPCILGHEGAGVIESVGEEVTGFQPGDHVLPLYIPQCGECRYCQHPKTNLCSKIRNTQGKGVMPDGTPRFSIDGKPIFHYMGCSTFSEYTVVSAISLAKVDPKVPLDRLCLIGCGVSTGFGAALNTADVQKGDTVGIFGMGAVGLAVAVGAKFRGASRIIGIDINDKKKAIAEQFGITEFVNPKNYDKPIEQVLMDLTDGVGLDHTFECVGKVDIMNSALAASARGWGQSIIIGVAGVGQMVSAKPFMMITGRTWKGSAFGGWKSRESIAKLVDFYLSGDLPVDKFITHRKDGIETINEVFELLHHGESLRCVVTM